MTGCPDEPEAILECVEAGALGYHPIDGSLTELSANIQAVAAGKTLCSPRIASALFSRVAEYAQERHSMRRCNGPKLTPRELEVLGHVGVELSNKEIAGRLGISVQTVKNHVHNILDKLDLDGRKNAARYARRHGMLRYPSPVAGARDKRMAS